MDIISNGLMESINEYIETNEEFNQQFNQFINYLNSDINYKPIVQFVHQIDCNQINFVLLEYLVQNIIQFNSLFNEFISQTFETLLNGRKLWLCLKPKNLPNEFCVKSHRKLNKNENKIITIDCLQIVSISSQYKSCIGTKFINRVDCSQSEEWRVRQIGYTNEDLFAIHSNNCKESKSDRIYVTKRKALVIIGNDKNCGLNPLEITFADCVFTQNQLNHIYLGSHLKSVVLIQIKPNVYHMLSFDSFSQNITQNMNPFDKINFERDFVSQFPKLIIDLYMDRKESKYSFGLSLAYIFADNVCVSGSYFRLKLGLLLSLLSLDEYPKRKNSSVLVICDDTLMISRLFDWSSILSPNRYLQTSAIIPMAGVMRKESYLEWIDCGPLQLAANGVCVLTNVCELNQLPDRERTSLFHALETNEVIAKQSQPSEDNNNLTELKSTVWATIEHNSEGIRSMLKKNQTILWNEVFGMVYVIDDEMDYQSYEQLNERSLSRHVWQNVLDLMNKLKPIITSEAETILQSYYISVRRIRGSKCNRLSMETLVSLSKSFAKLSIRMSVTKYDALMAILLYEESLTSRFPQFGSPLEVEPISHVRPQDRNCAIGPKFDQFMLEFETRLMAFLQLYDSLSTKTNQNSLPREE